VVLPAGRYLSFSIRLLSGVTLRLEEGCVMEAADPAIHGGTYDQAEPNPHDLWQDFGHSHWRNSLIWADDVGGCRHPGTRPHRRRGPDPRRPWLALEETGWRVPAQHGGLSAEVMAELSPQVEAMAGLGNKAIALKNA
jgi:hypothetical protein